MLDTEKRLTAKLEDRIKAFQAEEKQLEKVRKNIIFALHYSFNSQRAFSCAFHHLLFSWLFHRADW